MIDLSNTIADYLRSTFGENFLNEYKNYVFDKYPVFIRANDTEDNFPAIVERLRNQGITIRKYENINHAFEVQTGENLIGKSIEHVLGKYYIQSLSSMLPAIVLEPQSESVVMDLCAAPGSKSTQIAELMNFSGTLISNEPNPKRIKALVHNLDKSHAFNMWVLRQKGELLSKRFPNYFDKILVDAPCSALGVLQKNQEVSRWWNSKSVKNISSLQERLLISAVKMSKIGAEIVYSTCTLTVEENEKVVNNVLKNYPVDLIEFDLQIPHKKGFTEIAGYNFDKRLENTKRILPWEIRSEGFFIAKLKKTASAQTHFLKPEEKRSDKVFLNAESRSINEYLLQLSEYYGIKMVYFKKFKFLLKTKNIYFFNADALLFHPDEFIRIGLNFGMIDKNNKIKLHSSAAQVVGPYATKNIIEIKSEEEIKVYFQGGVIPVNNEKTGQKIVKYKDQLMGTAVIISNGLKSQFPRGLRTAAIN